MSISETTSELVAASFHHLMQDIIHLYTRAARVHLHGSSLRG
jgi:hypothetical protein